MGGESPKIAFLPPSREGEGDIAQGAVFFSNLQRKRGDRGRYLRGFPNTNCRMKGHKTRGVKVRQKVEWKREWVYLNLVVNGLPGEIHWT